MVDRLSGLLASGFAFSLRLRTPNLAVVGAAATSMVVYSELAFVQELPPVLAACVAVLAAGMLGAALALAADRLGAPAWAVTLAGQAVSALVVAGLANPEAIAAAEPMPRWVRLLIGITGSSLLAGLAGVVAVLSTGDQFPNPAFGTFPQYTGGDLLIVLGAVLLGFCRPTMWIMYKSSSVGPCSDHGPKITSQQSMIASARFEPMP